MHSRPDLNESEEQQWHDAIAKQNARKSEDEGVHRSKGIVKSKTSRRRLTADHHTHRAVSRARILGSPRPR